MAEWLYVLVLFLVMAIVPATVTWAKGQKVAFFIGLLFFGVVWWVAACRLARPSSRWARRFYGPVKMERARRRFGVPAAEPGR